jgi:hypothetical protein
MLCCAQTIHMYACNEMPQHSSQAVKSASCFWAKGAKVGISRFFGAIYKFVHEEDKLWHTRLVGLLYWAIMAGKFTEAKFSKLDEAVAGCKVKVSKAEGAVPVAQGNHELKQLREVCDNGLHMAAVVYSNGENLIKMRAICSILKPTQDWHSSQNRALRSVGGSSQWMREQCLGAFWAPLVETLARLSHPGHLSRMGFQVRLDASTRGLPLEHPCVVQANDMAQFAAEFALTLIGCRLRRCLWLIAGWPSKFCLLSADAEAVRARARDELRTDYSNFRKLEQDGRLCLSLMCKRSSFQTASVMQLVGIMKSTDWEVTPAVRDFSRKISSIILSSQIVEDGFNRERRAEGQGHAKTMSDTRAYSVLIEKQVLDKVHHYRPLEYSNLHVPRVSCLPGHAYKSLQKDQSCDLKSVIGYNQAPKWYSPSAASWPQKFADMALLNKCSEQNLELLDTCWLSSLLDSTSLLVREKKEGSKWLFSLGTLTSGLGALGWPAQEESQPGNDASLFKFDLSAESQELHWIFIFDVEQWEAKVVAFKSPLWGLLKSGGHQPVAAIWCESSESEDLICIAAKEAFWHVPKALLVKLAEHIGLHVESSWSLFQLLWNLLKKVLPGMTDEKYLAILQKRLTPKQLGACDLCDIEVVEEILDKKDQEEMKKARREADAQNRNIEIFSKELDALREKVWAANAAAAKAKAKVKPTKRAKAAAASTASSSSSKALPVTGELSVAQVQHLAPPGSHAWRSRTGTWQIHLPPHKRFSRSWNKYGERTAAIIVLQECWKQHLGALGLTTAQCDVQGLF